jgi:hypothetical protein
MVDETYEAPTLLELGSLGTLTLGPNKIGFSSDLFSTETGLSGSIVPAQPH